MSKSPLSGAFSGSSEPAKKKKKNGAILLIAGIALTSSIGGVFAANSITLNGGSSIEFGQGTATTTSCDPEIDSKISQLYVTGDTFRVSAVELSNISTACSQTVIRVALIGADGTEVEDAELAATTTTTRTWTVPASPVISADAVRRVAVTTQD